MSWYKTIRLDRRSKLKPIDQFEQQLMDAIQLEKISFKSPLPTVNSLEKTLHLPGQLIQKLFEKLRGMGILKKNALGYFVEPSNFVRYELPLPFSRRNPGRNDIHLRETIMFKGYVACPLPFLAYFEHPPIHVFHVRTRYDLDTQIKAISDVYYVVDSNQYPNEPNILSFQQSRRQDDAYIRLVNVVLPNEELNTLFQSSLHPLYLKGFYRFEKAPLQPYEIGIVTTVRQFSYRIQLKTTINDIF